METKVKVPKVKIPKIDLNTFTMEDLIVDSFWEDLYNPDKQSQKLKLVNN